VLWRPEISPTGGERSVLLRELTDRSRRHRAGGGAGGLARLSQNRRADRLFEPPRFEARLKDASRRACHRQRRALIYVDLDNFKQSMTPRPRAGMPPCARPPTLRRSVRAGDLVDARRR